MMGLMFFFKTKTAYEMRISDWSSDVCSSDLPDVPTLAESKGFKGFEAVTWFGLLAPSGTPQPVIDKLNTAVNKVLQNKSVVEKLEAEGSLVLGGSPEQFKQRLETDTALWAQVIREAGHNMH